MPMESESFQKASMISLRISLKRSGGGRQALYQKFYVPTSTFALMSCLSYFIDVNQVPGRMGMLLTLYLITVNCYNSLEAPKMRYFSYIEIWYLGVQLPICQAIFEYGIILLLKKYWVENFSNTLINKIDAFTFLLSLGTFSVFCLAYFSRVNSII